MSQSPTAASRPSIALLRGSGGGPAEAPRAAAAPGSFSGASGIDFVYCWAGEKTQQADEGELAGNAVSRHNDGFGFNEMRTSLRLLQLYAPWFNRVYLMVNGPAPVPVWAASDARIEMVDRCKLFPVAGDCPTRNTAACQAVAHRIPGLNEHFVYLEDDFFFVQNVMPSTFFTADGKPRIYGLAEPTFYGFDEGAIREVYAPRDGLSGPDMPPRKVPLRVNGYSHAPIPMLVSFSQSLENEFADWFAFVRSHKDRFTCCNASVVGEATEEDFNTVWPAMLYDRHAGVPASMAGWASMNQYCDCVYIDCVIGTLQNPTRPPYLNIANCAVGEEWHAAENALDQHSGHFEGAHAVLSPTTLASFFAVNFALAIAACWVICSARRSTRSRVAGFLGIETALQTAILLSYISLYNGYGFFHDRAGRMCYDPWSAEIMSYIMKCSVSLLMFLSKGNLKNGLSTVLAPGCTRFGKVPAIMLPMIPGVFWALHGYLSFRGLTHWGLRPEEYYVSTGAYTMLVGVLWQLVFQRKLSIPQWLALLLVTAASIAMGLDGDNLIGLGTSFFHLAIISIGASAVANISSEVLLKEMPMPTDLVIFFTNLFAGSFNYAMMSRGAAQWRLLNDPWMIAYICCFAAFGIVTAYLQKELSNIVMEVSGSFVIVQFVLLEFMGRGMSAATALSMLGVTMALLGIGVYSVDPLSSRAAEPALE